MQLEVCCSFERGAILSYRRIPVSAPRMLKFFADRANRDTHLGEGLRHAILIRSDIQGGLAHEALLRSPDQTDEGRARLNSRPKPAVMIAVRRNSPFSWTKIGPPELPLCVSQSTAHNSPWTCGRKRWQFEWPHGMNRWSAG